MMNSILKINKYNYYFLYTFQMYNLNISFFKKKLNTD